MSIFSVKDAFKRRKTQITTFPVSIEKPQTKKKHFQAQKNHKKKFVKHPILIKIDVPFPISALVYNNFLLIINVNMEIIKYTLFCFNLLSLLQFSLWLSLHYYVHKKEQKKLKWIDTHFCPIYFHSFFKFNILWSHLNYPSHTLLSTVFLLNIIMWGVAVIFMSDN